jgi:hypothetical protein
MQTPKEITQSADKVAIGLSFICALHCLLVPLTVALLPSAALLGLDDQWFHKSLLILVLPMSTFAIVAGLRKHRDKTVLALGAAGLLILIFAAAVGHDTLGENGERLITVAGSLLVAISHLRNLQLCQFRIPSFSFK